MPETVDRAEDKQDLEDSSTFSEVNELNHERNQVAKAEKQAASQETAGLLAEE